MFPRYLPASCSRYALLAVLLLFPSTTYSGRAQAFQTEKVNVPRPGTVFCHRVNIRKFADGVLLLAYSSLLCIFQIRLIRS